MIRFLRAFAWLRWRLMLNGVRGSRRRDVFEQVSRLLALIVPAAIVVMSLGSVFLVSGAGLFGGYALASGQFVSPDVIIFVARALLFGTTVLVVAMPVGAAAQTTSTRYLRLLLLPIPVRALHLVEVLAGLADPWLLFTLPGLVLFAGGLIWGGRLDVGLFVVAAGAAVAMVLASMAALVSFMVSWLFRDRRRAEMLTIIFVMSISAVALLPQFLNSNAEERRNGRGPEQSSEALTVAGVDAALPAWSAVLPSEAFGRVVSAAAVDADRRAAAGWLGVLVSEGVLFFWLSGLVHRRLLQSTEGSSGRRQRISSMHPPWRLPGVPVRATAVAWVMVRSGLRSVRGRVGVLLPGPMMALVSLGALRGANTDRVVAVLEANTHVVFAGSLLIAVIALQPFTMNQFSSDRTGLTLQFLLPVNALDLVRGKAIGGGVLFLIAASIAGVASAAVTGGGAPAAWAMTALGGLAIYVTITPVAALMSALFPVAADLSKTGSGGNPHTASALVGMVSVCLAILPALVIGVPGLLPLTPMGSLLAMGAWVCVVTTAAWLLLGPVSRVVKARRENLFLTK